MDNQYKGLGITSMVCGICFILLCWTVVMSGLCAVVGAQLGFITFLRENRNVDLQLPGLRHLHLE